MKLVTKHHLKKNGYYLMYRHDKSFYREIFFIKVKSFKKFTNHGLTFENISDRLGLTYPDIEVIPIPENVRKKQTITVNDHLNKGLTIDFFELEIEDMGEFI